VRSHLPTDRDYDRLARFRYALRRFLRFSEEAARRAGVSPTQYQLMLFVRSFRDDFPTIADLAERMQVSHHSAVELIDRSAGAGLLARERDRRDARRVRVRLTPKGARILERLVREHYGRLSELHGAVPAPLRFDIPGR
jgi:DNA-binding MarR family transcriptional regulator